MPDAVVMNALRAGIVLIITVALMSIGWPADAQTSMVTIDPSAYTGRYFLGGTQYTGKTVLSLPAGTYTIDNGASVAGSSFNFSVVMTAGDQAALISQSSSARASGSTLTFNTASVAIDPVAYTGRYYLTSHVPQTFFGRQTVILVPGLVYGIDNGASVGGSAFYFGVDATGQVSTTSAAATGNGSTLTFNNASVTIDPVAYTGRYYLTSHVPQTFFGRQTVSLVPGLVYGVDNGSFVAGSTFYFKLDAAGQVGNATPAAATGSGGTLIFLNVRTFAHPGGYTGTYVIGGYAGLSGPVNLILLPDLVTVVSAGGQSAYVTPTATDVTPSTLTLTIAGTPYTFSFGVATMGALVQHVGSLPLSSGRQTSLSSKLQAAQRSLAAGNATAAINQLNALINELRALVRSGQLSAAIAELLIAQVLAVIGTI